MAIMQADEVPEELRCWQVGPGNVHGLSSWSSTPTNRSQMLHHADALQRWKLTSLLELSEQISVASLAEINS